MKLASVSRKKYSIERERERGTTLLNFDIEYINPGSSYSFDVLGIKGQP
jgi:hypothetical protein